MGVRTVSLAWPRHEDGGMFTTVDEAAATGPLAQHYRQPYRQPWGLAHTLRDVDLPDGAALEVTVTGPAGGT